MKSLSLALLLIGIISAHAFAQDKNAANAKLPAATPTLSKSICGKGTFLSTLGEQSLGRETFEITCRADGGYSANGHSVLNIPGANNDLNTTIELDKAGLPEKFSAKGTVNGTAFEQEIVLKDGTATVKTNGNTSTLSYTGGSSFIAQNVTYLFQFVLARYDTARGGAQQILLFPNQTIELERTAHDEAQAVGLAAPPKPATFDRYRMKIGPTSLTLWTDAQGHLAAAMQPEVKFAAMREEYAPFRESLRAALTSTTKNLEPDYSAPAGAPFTAEEVIIPVKTYKLAGTLLLPKNVKAPFPAVVTSTGSGQQTRDENLPLPGLENYKPFRQIAETLAARGIAVLRVDDRGVGSSTGIETLDNATTFDFADDVRAQIAYLRTRREIDPNRIAIIGHSEGGAIAPLVASTDPRLAAIVLLAGPAKLGDEILLYQFNDAVDSNKTLSAEEKARKREENRRMIQLAKQGGDTSRLPLILRFPWTKAFLNYDPLPTIKKVHQPMLILQGALDRNVTADQADMLAEAARSTGNKDVIVHVFPNLNHIFLPAQTGEESEYSKLQTMTIGDDVLKILSDWLVEKLRAGK